MIEGPEGYNKSTAWRILAGNANFSDEPVIGHSAREVMEQLAGVWICKAADLAGLSKKEVENVKAFASRTRDRARPAYGRMLKEQRRHCIIVGTTNADTYLIGEAAARSEGDPCDANKTAHGRCDQRIAERTWVPSLQHLIPRVGCG